MDNIKHPFSETFEFIKPPPTSKQPDPSNECGVWTTSYAAIKNASHPPDAAGGESFNNILLIALLAVVPFVLNWILGGRTWTFFLTPAFTKIPILAAFWTIAPTVSPLENEKVKYRGLPIQDYLYFRDEKDRLKYSGKRIPMETFHEMFCDEKVDFKGDCLDVMENCRLGKLLFHYWLVQILLHRNDAGGYLAPKNLVNVYEIHLKTFLSLSIVRPEREKRYKAPVGTCPKRNTD